MKFLDKDKGITLVALVITIVILIILATISVNVIFGNDGLVRKAQEASIATKDGTQKEELDLAVSSLMIDSITKNRRNNKNKIRRRIK